MKKSGSEEPVELIWPLGMKKRNHAADVMKTLDLRTERRLLVEVAMHEIAVLLRGDSAHPMDTDATRMPYHLAHHVLRHLVLVPTDREIPSAPLTSVSTVEQREGFSSILSIRRQKWQGRFRRGVSQLLGSVKNHY